MSRENELLKQLDPTHVTRGKGDATATRIVLPGLAPMTLVYRTDGDNDAARTVQTRYFTAIDASAAQPSLHPLLSRILEPRPATNDLHGEIQDTTIRPVSHMALENQTHPISRANDAATAIPNSLATTPGRKRTSEERLKKELAIDGTELLKGGGVPVSKVQGDEPDEWTMNKKIKLSDTGFSNSELTKTSKRSRACKKTKKALDKH